MAFVTIDPASTEVGDATKKEWFDRVKDNFDDHETRINTLESTGKKIEIFKFPILNASSFSTATGISYFRAEDNFTITKGAIQIFTKGSLTGNLEIDIKKSTTNMDNASFSTIYTTKPKIVFASAADYDESANQVIDAAAAIVTVGDYLRLDITIAPTNGPIPKFLITSYGE